MHQLPLNRLKQQGVNTDEAPALLRDLSKFWQSGIGIDPADRKGKLLLDNQRKRPIFQLRKMTRPMLEGLTIILPLKFG